MDRAKDTTDDNYLTRAPKIIKSELQPYQGLTLLERQDGGDCAHVDSDLVCSEFCSAVQVKNRQKASRGALTPAVCPCCLC